MSRIKVYGPAFAEIGTIDSVLSAARKEVINSDNTLSFSFLLSAENADWINDNNVIGHDGDYFDIAKYKNGQDDSGDLTSSVECEHISYRLNDSDYDLEYFTQTGTPAAILTAILSGTPFTSGAIEFTASTTYSIQTAMSRRGLLVQFAELLGGELLFSGFTVSILAQRGSSTPKDLMVGRNIEVISKSVDKTTLDDAGNSSVAYECSLINPMNLALGDVVTMAYAKLSINVELRIVSIVTNPYNKYEVSFSVSNTVPTVEDAAYEIATSMVTAGKRYYGARISAEVGFESVRNDKYARAIFNADEFKMQTGDGSGSSWTDILFFDPINKKWYFNGELSADIINAISALITPNLYADQANISSLTVDELRTSKAVKKYLQSDTGDDNFIYAADQWIEFVQGTAVVNTYAAERSSSGSWDMTSNKQAATYYSDVSVSDTTGAITFSGGKAYASAYDAYNNGHRYRANTSDSYYRIKNTDNLGFVYYSVYTVEAHSSVSTEQAVDRNGDPLYWIDDTYSAASATETSYPVTVYVYNALNKMQIGFEYDADTETYIPMMIFGAGDGTDSGNAKGKIYKVDGGLCLQYTTYAGLERSIKLMEGGVYITPFELQSLNFYNNGFNVTYSGQTFSYTWTKDGSGRITQLTTEDDVAIPVGWNSTDM